MNYIVGLFIIFWSFGAFAINCEKVRQDLLILEDKLQEAKFPNCSKDQPAPFCCDPEKPLTCMRRHEAEAHYNELLGKLVIAEGIISLGMAIESNHNAMVSVPASKLNEMSSYVSELDKNVKKADMLFDALSIVDGTSQTLWSEYRGTNRNEMANYVNQRCRQNIFNASAFCLRIREITSGETEDAELFTEYMETLNGFMNADNQVTDSDRERRTRFNTYLEKLSIRSGESLLSPEEYLNSDTYGKIQNLSKMIQEYKEKRRDDDTKEEAASLATQILKLSNELDQIKVAYADTSTSLSSIGNYISEHFDRVMVQKDVPDMLLTGPVKSNFENTVQMFNNDYKRISRLLTDKVTDFLHENRSVQMSNGQTIQNFCNGNYNFECVRRICGGFDKQSCNELNQIDLNSYFKGIKDIEKQKLAKNQLELATGCLDNEQFETVQEKSECLRELTPELAAITPTQVDELKQQLKDAHYVMVQQNRGQPFLNLNLEKAMVLNTLSSNACQLDLKNFRINRDYCQEAQTSDITYQSDRNVTYEALNLALDGEEIMIKLNHDLLRGVMRGEDVGITEAERNEFKQKCLTGKTSTPNTCKFFADQAAHKKRIADAQAKKALKAQQASAISHQYFEENKQSDAGVFFGALGMGVAMNAPSVLFAAAQRQNVRDTARSQIAYIEGYDTWYMNQLGLMREYYAQPPNANFANYGYDFNNPSTYNAATFQSQNVNQLYSFQDGIQFNYSPIPVTNPTVGPSPAGNTVPAGNDTFGFGF